MNLHRSQVLQIILLLFLLGVGLGRFFTPSQTEIWLYCSAIFFIVLTTVFWGNPKAALVGAAVFALFFGGWRWQASQPKIDEKQIAYYASSGKVEWRGVVAEEPDIRQGRTNLVVAAGEIILESGTRPVSGKVLVSVSRYPEYRYGDLLELSGKLQIPESDAEFSYRDYLSKDGIYSQSWYPKIIFLEADKGNFIKSRLLSFKSFFIERLSLVLPEPQNSFLAGLLVGAKRAMPDWLQDAFKITGITHIVAISGFNISIITRILGGYLQKRIGPVFSSLAVILVVAGFVIITGAQASVVRASIMGLLAILALNLGRAGFAGNILLFAGAFMVLRQPQTLVFDVGFQLSFLATAGLIFLSEEMERVLRPVPEFMELRSSLASTLSAQIFVLPLLIYYFDRLSIISPLTNLLILPAIPATMLLGFVSGILALIWLPLSYLSVWITWLFLSYQIWVAEFFSRLPFAAVSVKTMPVSWIAVYYLILFLAVFIIFVRKRERKIFEFKTFLVNKR